MAAQYRHPREEPLGCVAIDQVGEAIRFRLFGEGREGAMVPAAISDLTVRRSDDRITIWTVTDRRAYHDVFEVRYGIVPPNFRQTAPVQDPPAALEEGVRYHVFVSWPWADAHFIVRRPLPPSPCPQGRGTE